MKDWKEIKSLPEYLQPKILSAVAYIHECSPNLDKAVERVFILSTALFKLGAHSLTYATAESIFG